MRRAALLLLALAAAAPVVGQTPPAQPGHGERVAITGVSWPPLVVADRAFYLDVTLQNRQPSDADVGVFATLCLQQSQTPCDPSEADQPLSAYVKAVHLGPNEVATIDGRAEDWQQVVNGSRLDHDGAYPATVWVTLQSCAGAANLGQCYLDGASTALQVRLRNRPPVASIAVQPGLTGTTATPFTLRAEASDPDGDPVVATWDLGDGRSATGLSVVHRYATEGGYDVVLNVTDGFDFAEAHARLQVNAPPGGSSGGGGVPGPGVAVGMLAVTAAAALTAARPRGTRRPRRGTRRRASRRGRAGSWP